jgi:CBS domain containing-hemolysin-like protein
LGITFVHVVFGELIPKTVALQKPDDTALWVAMPLNVFAKATRPLLIIMNNTGNAILRWCGYRPVTESEMAYSVEELTSLVRGSRDVGILGRTQAEVVRKTFRLSSKQVKDCMVPRDKTDALELTTPPEQVLEALRKSAHTRMPVYQGTLDNIVGIVNTKDLFNLFSLNGAVVLEDALYPPVFLNAGADVFGALQLFRKSRRPMAIVRSDEGHFLGLITLEDVVEEIVGDIEDEHDDPTAEELRADWMQKKGPSR